MNNDGFIEEIIQKIESADPAVSKAALLICQDMVDTRFLEPLLRRSESDSREIRKLARDMVKNIVRELGITANELKEMQVNVRLELARERINDGNPDVRKEAVEYIVEHVLETECYEPLLQRLRIEASPVVLGVLIDSLAGFQNQKLVTLLRSLLEAETDDIRLKAAHALLRQENGRYLAEVQELMKSEQLPVRSRLAREICLDPCLLDQFDFDYKVTRSIKNLFSNKLAIRQSALKDLKKVSHSDREIPLLAALSDPDSSIQFLARKMLSQPPAVRKKTSPVVLRDKNRPARPAEAPAYLLYVSLIIIAAASGVFFWFMASGGVAQSLPAAAAGFQGDAGSIKAILSRAAASTVKSTDVEFQGRVREIVDRGAVLVMESEGIMVSVSLSSALRREYAVGQRVAVTGTVRDITRFGGVAVEPSELRLLD